MQVECEYPGGERRLFRHKHTNIFNFLSCTCTVVEPIWKSRESLTRQIYFKGSVKIAGTFCMYVDRVRNFEWLFCCDIKKTLQILSLQTLSYFHRLLFFVYQLPLNFLKKSWKMYWAMAAFWKGFFMFIGCFLWMFADLGPRQILLKGV